MKTSTCDLLKAGLLNVGDRLSSLASKYPGYAEIAENGYITFNGNIYQSPSGAAEGCLRLNRQRSKKTRYNGWIFWGVIQPDGCLKSLEELRQEYERRGPALETKARDALDGLIVSLIAQRLIEVGETLYGKDTNVQISVNYHGSLRLGEQSFTSLKDAAKHVEYGNTEDDRHINGWKYWHVLRNGKKVPLAKLRDTLIASE